MPKFFTRKPSLKEETIPEAVKLQTEPIKEEKPLPETEDETYLIKTYLSWTAPSRPFRKKDRSYYTTIAIIVILLALILLLAKEILLIGAILAAAFVAYVLAFVPPDDVEYKISSQGVTIGGHFYFWNHLDSFWFAEKEGQRILHILTHLKFPGELMLVLGGQDEEEIKKVVARFLPFHEIAPKSLMEKWGDSLQKHFPLENPHR